MRDKCDTLVVQIWTRGTKAKHKLKGKKTISILDIEKKGYLSKTDVQTFYVCSKNKITKEHAK